MCFRLLLTTMSIGTYYQRTIQKRAQTYYIRPRPFVNPDKKGSLLAMEGMRELPKAAVEEPGGVCEITNWTKAPILYDEKLGS